MGEAAVDAMIELRGVTTRYGAVVANDHLDLAVRRGELLTLLGPSGCGKTTALRTLTGYVRPSEGRVLLDEPLSNLDAKLREEMRFEIKDVVTRLAITAVYVTHDQEEALALSDRVAIMNRGRLEQLGTPEEIYGAPRSRFVAEFVGLSNFLEGRVEAVIGAEMTVAVGTLRVRAVAAPGVAPGQRVLLFVRPNEVVLAAGEAETTRGGLPGRVDKATYLGD